jgi:hypothetical protein
VAYEGWHKSWESQPTGLPEADIKWLRDDHEFGMFQPMQTYRIAATRDYGQIVLLPHHGVE